MSPVRASHARLRLAIAFAVLAAAVVPALASGAVDDLTLVSRADGADGGALAAEPGVAASGNGRLVAFTSRPEPASPEDVPVSSVYVRNLDTGTTTLVSRADGMDGAPAAGGDSRGPSISADGNLVAFESDADNLSGGRRRLGDEHLRPRRDSRHDDAREPRDGRPGGRRVAQSVGLG